jgi:hypothetical protein
MTEFASAAALSDTFEHHRIFYVKRHAAVTSKRQLFLIMYIVQTAWRFFSFSLYVAGDAHGISATFDCP